jgi:K(+)-stimulated pyrophosphate-energized sodium pump
MIDLTGNNVVLEAIVAVIGLAALAVAGILVREVLSASEGTERMKEIGAAVQEGASAYLNRQFKTLSIFAVVVFFLLFLLPAETNSERIGRSIFFLVGAVFSGITGYMGMWLAVRGNVRVAAAAKDSGEQRAMRIAFRTGGDAGILTDGLCLHGACHVHACGWWHLHQGRRCGR